MVHSFGTASLSLSLCFLGHSRGRVIPIPHIPQVMVHCLGQVRIFIQKVLWISSLGIDHHGCHRIDIPALQAILPPHPFCIFAIHSDVPSVDSRPFITLLVVPSLLSPPLLKQTNQIQDSPLPQQYRTTVMCSLGVAERAKETQADT